jgi:hypothetical protein
MEELRQNINAPNAHARRSIMKPPPDARPVRLPARAIRRIEDGEGLEVTTLSGTVWITQARDARDVILARGQSFILDRKGCAVVYALRHATIVVGHPGPIASADRVTTAA